MACMTFTAKNLSGEWNVLSTSGKAKGISPQQTVTGFKHAEDASTRLVLRDSWNTKLLQDSINGKGRIVTPFRAAYSLGDFLGRKVSKCGIRGEKCDASKIEATSGNLKYVSDSSLYTRFRRESAINSNYNDNKL